MFSSLCFYKVPHLAADVCPECCVDVPFGQGVHPMAAIKAYVPMGQGSQWFGFSIFSPIYPRMHTEIV